ncbi:MAG: DUF3795 domain-containing protein [Deltaproteobacteria bacterium]|nr:DUF3795 domain-containing protein [Deltaproteobacteria bacterium]NNK85632.1 DUF3795 domain-containing protein [Desulfobacterales bacterium]
MKISQKLASPCGLYCGVCAIYIAHKNNNTKFKEKLVGVYKGGFQDSEDLTIDDIHCSGCQSDDRFMYCEHCEIRDCAENKGYSGCHQCDDFPCQHIDKISIGVGKKAIMRSVPYRRYVGTNNWMQGEEARYVCPNCGNKAFRGAIKCNNCKGPLDLD